MGSSYRIYSKCGPSLNPQTLMSVHKIRMTATVMQCVETLLEAIPVSAIVDSKEMEGAVQVSMYHPVINPQLVELKIFTESFTNKTRYIGLYCLVSS